MMEDVVESRKKQVAAVVRILEQRAIRQAESKMSETPMEKLHREGLEKQLLETRIDLNFSRGKLASLCVLQVRLLYKYIMAYFFTCGRATTLHHLNCSTLPCKNSRTFSNLITTVSLTWYFPPKFYFPHRSQHCIRLPDLLSCFCTAGSAMLLFS